MDNIGSILGGGSISLTIVYLLYRYFSTHEFKSNCRSWCCSFNFETEKDETKIDETKNQPIITVDNPIIKTKEEKIQK